MDVSIGSVVLFRLDDVDNVERWRAAMVTSEPDSASALLSLRVFLNGLSDAEIDPDSFGGDVPENGTVYVSRSPKGVEVGGWKEI